MVIKKAPPRLLSIERGSRACVCQVIDKSEIPFLLVSVYLDEDLADVCSRNRLGRSGVKVVACTILEALAVLLENGFGHAAQ